MKLKLKKKKEFVMPTREEFEQMTAEERKAIYEAAKKEKEKKPRAKKGLIIKIVIAALVVVALAVAGIAVHRANAPEIGRTTYETVNTNTSPLKIDFSHIIIADGNRFDGMGFNNPNKYRKMKLTIRLGDSAKEADSYVSPVIEEGEVLISDKIPKNMRDKIKKGEQEAIAEVFVYDLNDNQLSRTSFIITIEGK